MYCVFESYGSFLDACVIFDSHEAGSDIWQERVFRRLDASRFVSNFEESKSIGEVSTAPTVSSLESQLRTVFRKPDLQEWLFNSCRDMTAPTPVQIVRIPRREKHSENSGVM